MSKLDDKFNVAIEEIKECFVVAQAMAKNSFKIGLQRDDLLAACELTKKRLLTHGSWDDNCFYYAGSSASELEEPLEKLKAAIAQCK
ncbi:hypothetical protein LCGC14_2738240 [marine sediment metagenome]|uniref:Uncharacterized protein n=1 Tax=marine sediment metagenome TaxID=412755 RepID=A0A0F8Z585_9ZZZZ